MIKKSPWNNNSLKAKDISLEAKSEVIREQQHNRVNKSSNRWSILLILMMDHGKGVGLKRDNWRKVRINNKIKKKTILKTTT